MPQARPVAPLLLWIALLALLVPIAIAAVPPLVDFPNHLARLWLLGGGASDPALSGIFRVKWDTLTNIGIDLVGAGLVRVLPLEVVGQILVGAACLLPPLGGVLLWRAVHGRWHWWQLSFTLMAWNLTLVFGFLNFTIGLGVALLAAAAEPGLGRRGPVLRGAARMGFSALLFVVHIFALPFYAALLAGLALGPRVDGFWRRERLAPLARTLAGLALTLVLPVAVLLLLAPSPPGTQVKPSVVSVLLEFAHGFLGALRYPVLKLDGIRAVVLGYDRGLDFVTTLVLLAPVVASAAVRRLEVHAGLVVAGMVLAGLYFVFPGYLVGTAVIDTRFAMMAPFALAAGLRPGLPVGAGRVAAAVLLGASLARTGSMGWAWRARQADVEKVSRALEVVPAGAAVLPLQHRVRYPAGAPPGRYLVQGWATYNHLPALAVPWRRAFVPVLFSVRGKQPLQVLPPWDAIVEPDGGLLASVHALTDPAVMAYSVVFDRFLVDWQARFDYALVLNADMQDDRGPFNPPDSLELLRDEGFARVYRINHAAPAR